MKTDDEQFEQRLQRQPMREVPSAWRDEILIAARNSLVPESGSRRTQDTWFSILIEQFSLLLSPHPRAWAGLAAAWLIILAMNFASREDSTAIAGGSVSPPTPQMREMLREQQQMLAELFDQPVAADRIKARVPRPQSFYRNELLNA
jgi:hypothetical protein